MIEYKTIFIAIVLILSGTIAGYITNKYAVRWLFQPISLFGRKIRDFSILSTKKKRETFIESISDCIEHRILTKNVLKQELCESAINLHIKEIIAYFISTSLPESFRKIPLKDLHQFEKSRDVLRHRIEESIDKALEPMLNELYKKTNLTDYLTTAQTELISVKIFEIFQSQLKRNPSLKEELTRSLSELYFTAKRTKEGRAALAKLEAKDLGIEKIMESLSNYRIPKNVSILIKAAISVGFSQFIQNKTLEDILSPENKEQMEDFLKEAILNQYDTLANKSADYKVEAYIGILQEDENFQQMISDTIYSNLNQNIMQLVNGRIKETVKTALTQMNAAELSDIAKNLLHGELKYLSYFGAFIGLLVSIPALMLTLSSTSIYGFSTTILGLLSSVLVMGFIGVLTNIIAIAMFFHPYKENPILAHLPFVKHFARGAILQNQTRFAKTLGEYIGKELLTPENALKTLDIHEALFKGSTIQNVDSFIKHFFAQEEHAERVANKCIGSLFLWVSKNKETISHFLTDGICKTMVLTLMDMRSDKMRNMLKETALAFLYKEREPVPLKESDEEDYQFIFMVGLDIIKESSTLQARIGRAFLHIYQGGPTNHINIDDLGNYTLGGSNIGSLLNTKSLSLEIEKAIIRLCEGDEDFSLLREQALSEIVELSKGLDSLFSQECKENIIERIAGGSYLAARSSVPAIVKDLHITELTISRIEGLQPNEIKDIIMSFAAPVFQKLYLLGGIGCFFGANCYLAVIIFLLDAFVPEEKKS